MNDNMNDTEIKIVPINNNDVRFFIYDENNKNVYFNNNVIVYTCLEDLSYTENDDKENDRKKM